MVIKIITPDEKVFEGDVISSKLPGVSGGFEVLKDHAAIVSLLETGKLRLRDDSGKDTNLEIDGGVVEVLKNQIVVLAESAKAIAQ